MMVKIFPEIIYKIQEIVKERYMQSALYALFHLS